ncbi:hypothetical protein BDR05DRAFT_789904 [Suillus weaverae]|nr:hypothetical protein BDR05DRAFT_789904 [Suillus weaverae]
MFIISPPTAALYIAALLYITDLSVSCTYTFDVVQHGLLFEVFNTKYQDDKLEGISISGRHWQPVNMTRYTVRLPEGDPCT